MNKKIILVLSVISVIVGIHLMQFQDESFDFPSGILVGIGLGSLFGLIAKRTKSNFDNIYNRD